MKNNIISTTISTLAVAVLLLSGCGSKRMMMDVALTTTLPKGQAVIHFLAARWNGHTPSLWKNNKLLGLLVPGTNLQITVPEGKHFFVAKLGHHNIPLIAYVDAEKHYAVKFSDRRRNYGRFIPVKGREDINRTINLFKRYQPTVMEDYDFSREYEWRRQEEIAVYVKMAEANGWYDAVILESNYYIDGVDFSKLH